MSKHIKKKSFLTKPGECYETFELKRLIHVEEVQIILKELVHLPTGAQILHIENDDPENLFCLSFRTLPSSSNGAAHILEHTVLCGSRLFPVKDPFFAMQKRSLNTFMNALTGSDFTCYPAATQVKKDFYNLLSVYLDAVFHPALKLMSFLQEGHRLEFSISNDPSSDLFVKGIVYNEMKGSLNSIDTRIWHHIMADLVPDLPYAFNSGGNPEEIRTLTYEQLIEFYETFYHPSRCLFFFYGNLSLKEHLDYLAQHALQSVPPMPQLPSLPMQRRFAEPVMKRLPYPIEETTAHEQKFIHTFSFLTIPAQNQDEVLALTILDSILMDTDASPLKAALLESKLCQKADSFIDNEMSEIPFVLICKGCTEESGPKIEEVIFNTLRTLADQGIPHDLVEAAAHQMEFTRTEISGDHAPFGLTLFMRAGLAKQNGHAPEQTLKIHELFEKLLEESKNPDFFRRLIDTYFIDNTHRLTITFYPDPEMSLREANEEKQALQTIKANLSEKQTAEILFQTQELAHYQKLVEEQQLSCLPKINIDEVPHEVKAFALTKEIKNNVNIYHHDCFTNHILYADLIFDLPPLAEVELFYLQLFAQFLTEVGTKKRSYAKHLEYVHAHTGGINATISLHVHRDDPRQMRPALHLHGKALKRKIPYLFELMQEIITSPRFDNKRRMEDLVLKWATHLHSRFNAHAMRYATSLALSGVTLPALISDHLSGLRMYTTVQTLALHLKKELSHLIEKMQLFKQKILRGAPDLILACDEATYKEMINHKLYGLGNLPDGVSHLWEPDYYVPPVQSQMRPIASAVAFTAYAYNLNQPQVPPYRESDAPALTIASFLMENRYLHTKVREQGGAYSVGATFNFLWRTFYFHAYRDPHIASTLRAFDDAIDLVAQGRFDMNDLEEAQMMAIQQADLPISPGSRALVAYNWLRNGGVEKRRQAYRDGLLALTCEEVQAAAKRYLQPQKCQGVTVCFAGEALIQHDNHLFESPYAPLPLITG